ncbi:hypothetical protein LSH36_51g05018 [Paralvinella palmiformis]|uniref:Uncharacterized protein n=1 Tax=Paralvinella palmiformis TaxID=53620 RepID=A0AAD9NE88_9ANNE|nr:hypothetical protein LSH36_51g05018 [Paralvinella palmiformis]
MSSDFMAGTLRGLHTSASSVETSKHSVTDGTTDVLKLFLCQSPVDQSKKRQLKSRRSSVKPILLRDHDKQRKRRPLGVDGSQRFKKKVRFDSKVAVRALPAIAEYSQNFAAEPANICGDTAGLSGAAPLCELSKLEHFHLEPDDCLRGVGVSCERQPYNDISKVVNDDKTLANVPSKSNITADRSTDVATKLLSNQSLSEFYKSAPLDAPNGLTSAPAESGLNCAVKVLPAGGNKLLTGGSFQSLDDSTILSRNSGPLVRPEQTQSAAYTADGLTSASVSRSTSRTLDAVVNDPEEERRICGDIQRQGLKDLIQNQYQDAVELDLTGNLGDDICSDVDISVNDFLSGASGLLIQIGNHSLCEVSNPTKEAVIAADSTSLVFTNNKSNSPSNEHHTALYSSRPLPNKFSKDLDPDRQVSQDIHQRSLPRILQDGGVRPVEDRTLECITSFAGDSSSPNVIVVAAVPPNREISGSVDVTAGTGLGGGEGLKSEATSTPTKDKKFGDVADRFDVHKAARNNVRDVGQNAGGADECNLAGETKLSGSIPVKPSHLPRLATNGETLDANWIHSLEWTGRSTGGYGGVDLGRSSSHNAGYEQQTVWNISNMAEKRPETGTPPNSDGDVSISEGVNPSFTGQAGTEQGMIQVSSDSQPGNLIRQDADTNDAVVPAVTGAADQTEGSRSEKFLMSESEESIIDIVDESAAFTESKLDMDSTVSVEEGSSTNLEATVADKGEGDVISSDGQASLAPLACEEEELDDEVTEPGSNDEEMSTPAPPDDRRAEGSDENEQSDVDSDVGASALRYFEQDGRQDSFAETDFTEDSETTFVMNADVDRDDDDDELPGPSDDKEAASGGARDPKAEASSSGGSMTEKFKMISQSGVLPGRCSLKTMLEQRAKFSRSSKQDDSHEDDQTDISEVGGPEPPVDKCDKDALSEGGELAKPISIVDSKGEAVTTGIPMGVTVVEGTARGAHFGEDPCRTQSSAPCFAVAEVPSGSLVAILDVAGVGEEVNISTLERKRKRAKSEEKTSSSHGLYADSAISQKDVEEAMKKLRKVTIVYCLLLLKADTHDDDV